MEARPGVSLMQLGYNDYKPGNIIYGEEQSAFVELTRTIVVQPNLAIDMPMPRFTFFMHRVMSNNEAFMRQEIEKLHLSSYYSPTLRAETNNAGTEMVADDKDGRIEALINTSPKVFYRDDEIFGQYYSVQDGKLYFEVWYWAGKVFIHQRSGNAGGICYHPYLTEADFPIPAEVVEQPYMQLITPVDEPIMARFYRPKSIRNL
ncbi:MAG: hypothetical protein ACRERU_03150 [Methylococcales bacterium]